MKTSAGRTDDQQSQSVANNIAQKQTSSAPALTQANTRPEGAVQRKLQEMANNSGHVSQLRKMQEMADSRHGAAPTIQRQDFGTEKPVQYKKWKALREPDIESLVGSLRQYITMGLLKVNPMDGKTVPANDNTRAVLESVLGEGGIDEEMPIAREALLKAAGLELSKEVVVSEKFSISSMKRSAFAAILTGKLGCTSQGKDGQNHDIYLNPNTGRTTSLGIGGHGSPTQDEGVLKTYLSQLGITASEWNTATA